MNQEKHETHVVVDGVELTITQEGSSVSIAKVVARDRKRKIDITSGVAFGVREVDLLDPVAIAIVKELKKVAATPTARCTCDYCYGYSDHAEHCESIYVATYRGFVDDD